jgi:hypothetical protein
MSEYRISDPFPSIRATRVKKLAALCVAALH